MNRSVFLDTLQRSLGGIPPEEVRDIIGDYEAHYADGLAAGRSEEEISSALGDPIRLGRELRAEAGIRRWEENRTPVNFFGAIFALLALITVNFVFLLPALVIVLLMTFISGLVVMGLFVAGLAIIVDLDRNFLFGLAFLGFSVGGGALLILLLDFIIALLGRYARLHYAVINQAESQS